MWRLLTASALILTTLLGPVVPAMASLEGTQVVLIGVRLHTANESNAETNATIFLGFGGRELDLDTTEGDRDRNEVDLYRIGGKNSNLVNPKDNDPVVGPRILLGDVHKNQVYLRMKDGDTDHWIVHQVDVVFQAFQGQILARYCFFGGRAILGPTVGYKLPLVESPGAAVCP
jgi:hypothetical protein